MHDLPIQRCVPWRSVESSKSPRKKKPGKKDAQEIKQLQGMVFEAKSLNIGSDFVTTSFGRVVLSGCWVLSLPRKPRNHGTAILKRDCALGKYHLNYLDSDNSKIAC